MCDCKTRILLFSGWKKSLCVRVTDPAVPRWPRWLPGFPAAPRRNVLRSVRWLGLSDRAGVRARELLPCSPRPSCRARRSSPRHTRHSPRKTGTGLKMQRLCLATAWAGLGWAGLAGLGGVAPSYRHKPELGLFKLCGWPSYSGPASNFRGKITGISPDSLRFIPPSSRYRALAEHFLILPIINCSLIHARYNTKIFEQ